MAVIKHKSQRVGIFIDTQNLYHSAKNLYNARVNFGNIVKDALADRQLVRALAYVISTESGEEKPFFEALEKLGIETKTKDLQIFYGGAKKADWDVGIAVDAIRLASKVDVIVIVAGDGDFVPLVEHLKSQAVQVEVVAFGKSTSGKLREVTDHFLDLCENANRYVMRPANLQRGRRRPMGRNFNRGGQAPGENGAEAPAAPSTNEAPQQ